MYPSTSLFIAIGQLAIVILVLFSYPLQVHPCRNCLDKVFHLSQREEFSKPVADLEEFEEEDEIVDETEEVHVEMSKIKHTILTAVIISSGFSIAYCVDDLQMGNSCGLIVMSGR